MTDYVTDPASSSPEEGAEASRPLRFFSRVGVIASLSILLLAVLLAAEVVARGLFSTSIRGLYEIAELLIVVVVFLGIAQAEVAQNHVRVTILTDRFPSRVAGIVRGAALVLSGSFLAWMFVALSVKAWDSFESREFKVGLLNFPVWPSRTIVAIGVGLLVAVCLLKGVRLIVAAIRSRSESKEVDRDR